MYSTVKSLIDTVIDSPFGPFVQGGIGLGMLFFLLSVLGDGDDTGVSVVEHDDD